MTEGARRVTAIAYLAVLYEVAPAARRFQDVSPNHHHREEHMKRSPLSILALAAGLNAQTANPLSTELQQSWTRTIGNVVAAAEKMPEDGYANKPSPESQSFATSWPTRPIPPWAPAPRRTASERPPAPPR